jgi:hypothetical protein
MGRYKTHVFLLIGRFRDIHKAYSRGRMVDMSILGDALKSWLGAEPTELSYSKPKLFRRRLVG